MKDKRIISSICLSIVFLLLFTFFIIQANKDEELLQTSAELQLSNVKIGWGVKREKEHVQPDLGTKNKALMESLLFSNGTFY